MSDAERQVVSYAENIGGSGLRVARVREIKGSTCSSLGYSISKGSSEIVLSRDELKLMIPILKYALKYRLVVKV